MTSKAPNVAVHLPQKAFYHFIQLINEEYALIDIMFITSSIFAYTYFAIIYFHLCQIHIQSKHHKCMIRTYFITFKIVCAFASQTISFLKLKVPMHCRSTLPVIVLCCDMNRPCMTGIHRDNAAWYVKDFLCWPFETKVSFNSLRPSDAYMRQ